jgi:hypothetical protein
MGTLNRELLSFKLFASFLDVLGIQSVRVCRIMVFEPEIFARGDHVRLDELVDIRFNLGHKRSWGGWR